MPCKGIFLTFNYAAYLQDSTPVLRPRYFLETQLVPLSVTALLPHAFRMPYRQTKHPLSDIRYSRLARHLGIVLQSSKATVNMNLITIGPRRTPNNSGARAARTCGSSASPTNLDIMMYERHKRNLTSLLTYIVETPASIDEESVNAARCLCQEWIPAGTGSGTHNTAALWGMRTGLPEPCIVR